MNKISKVVPSVLLLFFCLFLIPRDSQATDKKLLIGLIPEMNVFKQKQRFDILGEYITKKTGIEIKFTILTYYGNIIESFKKEKLDGAFLGSFSGYASIHKLGLIPIVRPVNLDNTSAYQGYIFVRKDSNIKDVKDMKGKKMAFVAKATTAGYVFPLAYLKEQEITDYKTFFKEFYFTGSHDAAINDVLNKKADIGAAKHSMYDRMRKENPRIDKELVILAKSAWVPSNGLCVSKNLNAMTIKQLKDTLLNMNNDPEGQKVLKEFGAVKFIVTTAKDYDSVDKLAHSAGIDIDKYNWRNE